jgi:hypothetical protein
MVKLGDRAKVRHSDQGDFAFGVAVDDGVTVGSDLRQSVLCHWLA